jgi:protein involved in polysaccharide export with SLBB domain
MNESATTMFAIKGVNTRAKILELYRSASATAVATVDTNGVPDFPNALVSGVIVGDSVRVAVPGLTTATGDAVVCYRMAASAAPDTLPSFRINAAGYITLTGKHGYTVKAFVGRK